MLCPGGIGTVRAPERRQKQPTGKWGTWGGEACMLGACADQRRHAVIRLSAEQPTARVSGCTRTVRTPTRGGEEQLRDEYERDPRLGGRARHYAHARHRSRGIGSSSHRREQNNLCWTQTSACSPADNTVSQGEKTGFLSTPGKRFPLHGRTRDGQTCSTCAERKLTLWNSYRRAPTRCVQLP